MNLKFKSSEPDLKFKTQINKLDVMASNILYLTHEVDKLRALMIKMSRDLAVQKQVDDFYETSPQTESAEQ